MPELFFFDPSGTLDISQKHAARLPSLAGKKIGLLANDEWQSHRTFELLKQVLENDIPGIDVLSPDHFPQGNAILSEPATIQHLKKIGVDAVIIGNAA